MGSLFPLKSSIIYIFKFSSSNATKVSPSNGALLIIDSFSIAIVAFGKFLNKIETKLLKNCRLIES